jgi:ceramide glucosyltransferase
VAHQLGSWAGLALLLIAALYSLLTLAASIVWALMPRRRSGGEPLPGVTILKPLCGAEPGLYENLRSFCVLAADPYQVILGLRDPADPALAVAQRLQREFPQLDLQIVVSPLQHGSNRKVSNLINMLGHAKHEVLIIADSDARVAADYLHAVTAPLRDPRVGLVTTLFRSLPVAGVWQRLGAMYVNDWYMPSVLLAWLFGHRSYASGQTMAFRQDTLRAMGGLQAIADHLADDYEFGSQVRALGQRIVLSPYLPEALQYEADSAELFAHELRWMSTLRVLAPTSFAFLFLSFSLPLAALGWLLAAPGFATTLVMSLLATTLLTRLGLFLLLRLQDERLSLQDLWLLPVRDVLLVWVWWRGCFASRLVWRDNHFEIDARGIMRSPS